MSDEVKETLTDDGREVFYSLDEETDEPAEIDKWIASDTIVTGGDLQ